jgi:hypothetical protein
MSSAGWVIMLAALFGVLALVLAALDVAKPARELARGALWLSIAIVPVSIAGPLMRSSAHAVGKASETTQLSEVIATVTSSGLIAFLCAGLASLALKKANAARLR